jgi:uncharacterized protein
MSNTSRRLFLSSSSVALLAVALPAAAQTTTPTRNRALFQVTDNDPARWNLILNNLGALKEGVGSEGAEIELVAYGPGVNMLKADSPVKERIAAALKNGVRINACQNTMRGMKLTPADMLADVGYVPSGVVEVMKKQQQGWAYIRS